jgi:hypothetical protein
MLLAIVPQICATLSADPLLQALLTRLRGQARVVNGGAARTLSNPRRRLRACPNLRVAHVMVFDFGQFNQQLRLWR